MTKLSRSKIELFLDCPRCFWLEVSRKIKRPSGAPYTINNAIDFLLKQEFDIHREKGTPHPLMVQAGIDALPYKSPEIDTWRHNFTGVQFDHKKSGFHVFGAVDDVWVNPSGELIVVDYKATGANQHQIYDSYRRQMEVYQWLLAANGYKVSRTGYFVFAKASKAGGFGMGEAVLPFDIFVEPLLGDPSWVDGVLMKAREVLDSDEAPMPASDCEYCRYVSSAQDAENVVVL